MTPTPSPSPVQTDVVVNILDTLDKTDRLNFPKAEIVRLGAFVQTFNPNDEDFFDSETQCHFKPISHEDLKPWKISAADAAEVQSSLDIPALDLTSQGRLTLNIVSATMHVFQFIMTQFELRQQGKAYMGDKFGWGPIDPKEFYGGNKGFLFSASGRVRGVDTPGWKVRLLDEWWDGEILVGPSIRFILCTNGVGEEDSLLLSELGSIAQVIAFRRTQPEFQGYSVFPVLMLSLFGPRHRRIVQACYNRRGDKLELWMSKVFSFATRDDAAFDIFLRYTASYPPEIANRRISRPL